MKIAFLVLPEFSNLGLAAAIEPLFVANWLVQKRLFEWVTVSLDGRPVAASAGNLVPVDGDLTRSEGSDTVFVLASFDAMQIARDARLGRWLRRQARAGVELGGLENGTLALAEAGLFKSSQVAVHWDNIVGFKERHPDSRPVSQLFVLGPQRLSCAGGAAILDLMVAWMDRHGHHDLALEVAQHLLLGQSRRGEQDQRTPAADAEKSMDRGVLLALRLMRKTVDQPLTCEEIAQRVGMSLRQLERHFRSSLGCSVLDRYRLTRIEVAHRLLQQTEINVIEAAVACGFSSPEYFCRVYRRHFGRSPSADRRQSTAAPVLRQLAPIARAASKSRRPRGKLQRPG